MQISGHGNWTVSDDGCGAEGFGFAAAIAAAVALVAAAVTAVVWFVTANALVLELGAGGTVVVVAVSTWVLHRYRTVLYYNPAALAAARRKPQQVTTTVIHRHVFEYTPAPAAIEAPNQVIQAAVIAAAEAEEIQR